MTHMDEEQAAFEWLTLNNFKTTSIKIFNNYSLIMTSFSSNIIS